MTEEIFKLLTDYLSQTPVCVQHGDAAERQGQASDADDGVATVEDQIEGPGRHEQCPSYQEAEVADSDSIQVGWLRREVVDGQARRVHGGGWTGGADEVGEGGVLGVKGVTQTNKRTSI